ncbi:hypothetical protein GCM10009731_41820 [Streptomyces globosus]
MFPQGGKTTPGLADSRRPEPAEWGHREGEARIGGMVRGRPTTTAVRILPGRVPPYGGRPVRRCAYGGGRTRQPGAVRPRGGGTAGPRWTGAAAAAPWRGRQPPADCA